MYCTSCGTELPDDANFCFKCGQPQKSERLMVQKKEEAKYEYCEVEFENIQSFSNYVLGIAYNGRFVAKGVGPQGTYQVGRTQSFPYLPPINSGKQKTAENYLGIITSWLLENGWEPTDTKGQNWFSFRFRRKIASQN